MIASISSHILFRLRFYSVRGHWLLSMGDRGIAVPSDVVQAPVFPDTSCSG